MNVAPVTNLTAIRIADLDHPDHTSTPAMMMGTATHTAVPGTAPDATEFNQSERPVPAPCPSARQRLRPPGR